MLSFINFLNESIIDPPRKSLDKKIFNNDLTDEPVLNTTVKQQVVSGLDEIERLVPIDSVVLVGSILTKHYSDDSDLDITVRIDPDAVDDVIKGKLINLLRHINGRMAMGTQHPINYHVEFIGTATDISDRFDNIYDISTDKWLKKSEDATINVSDYLQEFISKVRKIDLATMCIRRNLIDIEKLNKFDPEEISDIKEKIQVKLMEIERQIKTLADAKHEITLLRRMAYDTPLSPEQMQEYQSKGALPENIIYKLLERYYYWELIQKLSAILDEKKTLKAKDIRSVEDAMKDFSTKDISHDEPQQTQENVIPSFSSYISEGFKLKQPKSFKKPKLATPGKSHPSKQRRLDLAKNDAHKQRSNKRQQLELLAKWRENQNKNFPVDEYIPSQFNAMDELKRAKKAKAGQWFLNKMQAKWIARNYHFELPNIMHPIKHLSNMPIVLWCAPNGSYWLFKDPRLMRKKNNKQKYFHNLHRPSSRKFRLNKFNTLSKRKKYKEMEELKQVKSYETK